MPFPKTIWVGTFEGGRIELRRGKKVTVTTRAVIGGPDLIIHDDRIDDDFVGNEFSVFIELANLFSDLGVVLDLLFEHPAGGHELAML